ncbi:MAG: MarR family transcriptional regulator [Rhodothermia bacterium]|nr:MarR family transcriptional regulator [Rhodothermia bacterium]
MKLAERLKQSTFESPSQESMLNVMVTNSWLLSVMAGTMGAFDITPAQYNVLRILRGSHPNALTCSDIGSRLIDRTPDVTRLLNRLQKRMLISRERADHDRRVVEVHITKKGLDLLKTMDPAVAKSIDQLGSALSASEHKQLSDLLDRFRTSG